MSDEITNNETEQAEQVEPRTIDELIDLPYSEMTEEEIELVVEFKTQVRLRDEEHAQKMEIINNAAQQMIATNQAIADENRAILNSLVNAAVAKLENED